MRKLLALPLALLLAVSASNANAFFFFFIPGGVIGKIGDALTGAEGDICVKDSTKVGQVLTSGAGNKATVKSLSGTSSRCRDPALPIRALLVFEYLSASKAGMDVPDGYSPKQLTDLQRFNGFLLSAENFKTQTAFMVNSLPRNPAANQDMTVMARNIAGRMATVLENVVNSNDEKLQVNGLNALRFEVRGKNKGIFGKSYLYVVTIIESDKEYLILNSWSPNESEKSDLQQLATRISGLSPVVAEVPVVAQTASAPASAPGTKAAGPDGALAQTGNTTAEDSTSAIAAVGAPLRPAAAPTPVTVETPAAPPVASSLVPPSTSTSGISRAPTAVAAQPLSRGESVGNRLRELDKLRKEGVITQSEFEQKKKSLLKEM